MTLVPQDKLNQRYQIEEEQIHLVDFGAAQHLLNPEGGRTVVDTFGYMAPEQFAGKAERIHSPPSWKRA